MCRSVNKVSGLVHAVNEYVCLPLSASPFMVGCVIVCVSVCMCVFVGVSVHIDPY